MPWALLRYIQPDKPNQNAFIERFNQTYRTEVLDVRLFANLQQAQAITDQRPSNYNEYRLDESLGDIPPVQFMPRLALAPEGISVDATRQGCLQRYMNLTKPY